MIRDDSDWPDADAFEYECIKYAQEKQAKINEINAYEIAFGNIVEETPAESYSKPISNIEKPKKIKIVGLIKRIFSKNLKKNII
jgi:hypothetical protein